MHRLHRRQGTIIPSAASGASLSGTAIVATNGVNTESLLVSSVSGANPALSTSVVVTPSPQASSSSLASEPTASPAKVSATSNSLSIGAVIGICVGVFLVLAVLLLLIYQCQRRRVKKMYESRQRNIRSDADRRKSGREAWVKMDDDKEKPDSYAMNRTTQFSTAPSSTVAPQSPISVERSMTVKSAKSTKTFKSGLGFSHTFKTPEVPPQLEFTDASMGDGIVQHPSIAHPFARAQAPMSWDSRTVGENDSYLTLKRESDNTNHFGFDSPVSSVVVSHPTPPAVETNLHQWEKAEVVSPESPQQDAYGGVELEEDRKSSHSHSTQATIRKASTSRNPFVDMTENPFQDPSATATLEPSPPPLSANGAPSITSASTTSFSIQPEFTPREQQFSNVEHEMTHHHERSTSNDHAMASLIAALDITPEQAQERLSAAGLTTPRASMTSSLSFGMQSLGSQVSEMSDAETIDEERYRRFPLPPNHGER